MPNDQHFGNGGSYIVNPDTQERELVERTKSPEEAAAIVEQEKPTKAKVIRKPTEE